jgi:hypothetical protein
MATKNIFVACLFLIAAYSCKKNSQGGSATITANVSHHGTPINAPTVYVKFGAKEQPSDPTNNYDLKVEGKHDNHIHVKEMRYGNYYLFATGFDSTIMKPVSGGTAVKIKWSERRKETQVSIEAAE